ncbi:hypothetical protein U27_02928 [Candidatus Vecturithrix granuli]|uniref:Uncharacterized protein n=1 Tax=Vecturithrix granuli TaxID=1499967 RepID=A0A081BUG2_VECG1|nr:hypothetical protein U27_02928 [Candidatus Vecturithrix granuli]
MKTMIQTQPSARMIVRRLELLNDFSIDPAFPLASVSIFLPFQNFAWKNAVLDVINGQLTLIHLFPGMSSHYIVSLSNLLLHLCQHFFKHGVPLSIPLSLCAARRKCLFPKLLPATMNAAFEAKISNRYLLKVTKLSFRLTAM